MQTRVIVTVDVERDYPNRLDESYVGISEGLPRLLDLLSELRISGDFFLSGEIVERFPDVPETLKIDGHCVGNHGAQHGYLCEMDLEGQLRDVRRSTQILSKGSFRPLMFRAPQFGANGNTITALERVGYKVDSSVLPGRLVKRGMFGRILDFTHAPQKVYNPSTSDIAREGGSPIIEIPLTQNPSRKGTPIGMGYLNSEGAEAVLEVIRRHGRPYCTFLIHPWECVDLHASFPDLPKHLRTECSSNLASLGDLLQEVRDTSGFTNLMQVADEYVSGGLV